MLFFNYQTPIFKRNGLTLVEVLIGTFLVLIVFLGIFGAYQLGLKVVGQSKARIDATALANQRLEMVKNLPYEEIGTDEVGCHPCGDLEKTVSLIRNNIEYTIETKIDYVLDSADGELPEDDECFNDYKKAEIKVSWIGQFSGEVSLFTDIVPKNLAQECGEGGGVLSVSVADVSGNMVPAPLIEIKDPITDDIIKTTTPTDPNWTKVLFSLAPGTYKVVVSKSNYNTERTYGVGEEYNGEIIAIPKKPHPIVLEGELTEISFAGDSAVDKLSAFSVDTLATAEKSPTGYNLPEDMWDEPELAYDDYLPYWATGYFESIPGWTPFIELLISPSISCDKIRFYTGTTPEYIPIIDIDVYYADDWHDIYEGGFNQNEWIEKSIPAGTVIVSEARVRFYSTGYDEAQLNEFDFHEVIPIANAAFRLQGLKIVGHDNTPDEKAIYKYSQEHISDGDGHLDIPALEWDDYTFLTTDPAINLNADSEQPIYLSPDTTSLAVKLYLDAKNSLLVTVKDIDTGEPIPGAKVRLYKTDYEETQYTGAKGQTYFIPLEVGNYNLKVSMEPNYFDADDSVYISEDVSKIMLLSPQ